MGGNVFTSVDGGPALHTPRMSPELYSDLKPKYLALLQSVFHLVACPCESPDKESYGDIDYVVAEPDQVAIETIWRELDTKGCFGDGTVTPVEMQTQVLKHLLRPERYQITNHTWYFALPHPTEEDVFIQVDVNLQPADHFLWHLFHTAYGDFWNILGPSLRALGLTLSDTGLYVRDIEIEKHDRKRGRVFLTREPSEVLALLSLDRYGWETGWATEKEMFDYVTTCRYFDPQLYIGRSNLNTNDRQRLKKRPSVRRFVEDFVPELLETLRVQKSEQRDDSDTVLSTLACSSRMKLTTEAAVTSSESLTLEGHRSLDRDKVTEEALDLFHARQRFEANRQEWQEERDALKHKWEEKAARRAIHEANSRSYDQRWIDWLNSPKEDSCPSPPASRVR